MAVGAAESFGDFNGFVDDDRIGGLRHGAQLMAGNQQNGAFDRAEIFLVAVEQGADFFHVFFGMGLRAEKQFVEQLFIHIGRLGQFADVFGDFGSGCFVDACLINGLYGKLACAAAWAFHGYSL